MQKLPYQSPRPSSSSVALRNETKNAGRLIQMGWYGNWQVPELNSSIKLNKESIWDENIFLCLQTSAHGCYSMKRWHLAK